MHTYVSVDGMKYPDLKAEINRQLLESGELERLECDLQQLLQEAGWLDQLKQMCQERMREPDPARRVKTFAELLQAVEGDAVDAVPDEVRVRIMKSLLGVLRNMVD